MQQMPTCPVLAANIPEGGWDKLSGILSRSRFKIIRVSSAEEIREQVIKNKFTLIVLGVPIEDERIEDILHVVRHPDMPCRGASVLLLCRAIDLSKFETLVGRGVNRALSISMEAEKLQQEIARLTMIAPRVQTRLLTRLYVNIRNGSTILCRSENISISGILLKTSMRYPVGTSIIFEFSLPGDPRPIKGGASIVRHTDTSHENVNGMGLKFLSFLDDGERRLKNYIEENTEKG